MSATTPDTPTLSVSLDDATLERLADAVAVRVAALVPDAADDPWLDSPAAADHLALSVNSLHKLTAADAIRYSQREHGGKLYFRRSWLDEYREAGC